MAPIRPMKLWIVWFALAGISAPAAAGVAAMFPGDCCPQNTPAPCPDCAPDGTTGMTPAAACCAAVPELAQATPPAPVRFGHDKHTDTGSPGSLIPFPWAAVFASAAVPHGRRHLFAQPVRDLTPVYLRTGRLRL